MRRDIKCPWTKIAYMAGQALTLLECPQHAVKFEQMQYGSWQDMWDEACRVVINEGMPLLSMDMKPAERELVLRGARVYHPIQESVVVNPAKANEVDRSTFPHQLAIVTDSLFNLSKKTGNVKVVDLPFMKRDFTHAYVSITA